MKYFRKILSSPWILSFIPLAIVVAMTTGTFRRYLLETEKSGTLGKGQYIYFDDINNNGIYEKFHAINQDNSTGLVIRENEDVLDQWNFTGSFDFDMLNCLFITGDREDDGEKEVYVFTLAGDSILLHCIADYSDSEPEIRNRFIVNVGPGIKNPDPFIIPAEMQDLDEDGIKELIFGVSTGFSVYPRNVFAYFIEKDSLIMSPESSYFISEIDQYDLDGDGKKEIIPHGYSTGNVEPDEAIYHDHSAYLMVLNQDLKFLFPPVEFREENSTVRPLGNLPGGDSLLTFLFAPRLLSDSTVIYRINKDGILSDSVTLGYHIDNIGCIKTKRGKINYLAHSRQAGLIHYDNSWRIKKIMPGFTETKLFLSDLDSDGIKEFCAFNFYEGTVTVFRNGLKRRTIGNFMSEGSSNLNIVSLMGSEISIQSGQHQYLLKYLQNPGYPYYYLVYVLIYAGIVAFSVLVRTSQKRQMQIRYDNEKKISELQLALVKNQLDPHFTLNAINSIIYSAEFSDKAKTGDQLRAFAGLYRNMLLSATSVQRTISEELDFCRNYLELEKMRFGKGLDYSIDIAEDVDPEVHIPKFSIQIHAENAVKHGLSKNPLGGILKISIKKNGNDTIIEISDNGMGRAAASAGTKVSTGKGLIIMEELFNIYNKYYSDKVSSEIIDLHNDQNEPAGTLVIIKIRKGK